MDKMIKDFMVWLLAVVVFGLVSFTARYTHDILMRKEVFSFKRWLVGSFIGSVVAVLAGLICKNFMLSPELTYAVAGMSAISSKEILENLPDLIVKIARSKYFRK